MNIHKYARPVPHGREILVDRILEEALRVTEAAHASRVSVRTAYKWLARYRALAVSARNAAHCSMSARRRSNRSVRR